MKLIQLAGYLLLTAALFVFSQCKKDDDTDPNETGHFEMEFDNIVGGEELNLGTGTYTNAAGESFSVTLLNYYISNIELIRADGSVYTMPQDSSYFLVKESDETTHAIEMEDVPAGDYTSVRFVVGVDSLRNTMDIGQRTGVLDPANNTGDDNMYWTWHSGYIFFKMEGLSSQAPVDPGGLNKYRFHIGGFGGMSSPTINNVKTVTLDFNGVKALVRKDAHPHAHIFVDVAKVFEGETTVKIAENATVMFNPFSVNIANNYQHMFVVDHIHQ